VISKTRAMVLVLVSMTASCAPDRVYRQQDNIDVSPEGLARYHWRLADARSARGERLDAFVGATGGQPMALTFSGSHSLGAYAGCNYFSESYTLEGGRLLQSTESLATLTAMSCVPSIDHAMVAFLTDGPAILESGTTDAPHLRLRNVQGDHLDFAGKLTARTRYRSEGDIVHVEIDRQSAACRRSSRPRSCMSVRELAYAVGEAPHGEPGVWMVIEDGIEGFEEFPASTGDLLVRRFRLQHPRPDQSSFAYVRLDW